MVKTFSQARFLAALEKVGWLAALPAGERRKLTAAVKQVYRELGREELSSNEARLFLCLAVTSFDTEVIEGAGPDEPCSYHSVLKQLAKHSFGLFKPRNLHDELDEAAQQARIAFALGKQAFHLEVPWESDWFDGAVIDDLVNLALAATGVEHRFQVLPSVDQCANLAFVPDAVWRKALKAGLVPDQSEVEPDV